MDYAILEPARLFLAYLPLLPFLPLLAVAIAAIIDIGREVWATLTGWPIGMSVDSTPALAFAGTPVDRTIGDSGGPMVRFIREERAARAVETARLRGDVALTIRASIAWHNGDYGRALALAGAACRKGR